MAKVQTGNHRMIAKSPDGGVGKRKKYLVFLPTKSEKCGQESQVNFVYAQSSKSLDGSVGKGTRSLDGSVGKGLEQVWNMPRQVSVAEANGQNIAPACPF